ncbi:GtrA family protein [Apilactobacillus nanyangensis]|uniref:GtrA family protein n=1 Tax=Apilactobacillus nanyangensis TaxID=2799579 RepID=A0ABT0HX02_9LACO|nr:GtrA family protein [Apilactobacillus nanyangensis]MCK8611465.1 GtrA family protein [Apilactobacillus nanyangensis]TMT02780.1 GtrA family protein [Apilactobacillus kunkeei]TMT04302.1 GtrA family protein [Apilactobacillus kunkeei]
MKKLWNKYKQVIAYLFWGVLTTVIDIAVALVLYHLLPNMDVFWNTLIAWIASVLFAFFTNRKWVFESQATNAKEYISEMISFFLGRLASLILEEIILIVGVNIVSENNFDLLKIFGQIIVIIFNYFWSKFVVFVNHKSK